MTPKWFHEARLMCWNHGNCKGLLDEKDVKEINAYAVGNYSMRPYKMMFKSQQKALANQDANGGFYNTQDSPIDGFVCTPLINVKINAARALVSKIPEEVDVRAQDPLAIKKKEEDINFIVQKPKLEAELQDIADQMQIGTVDLGGTKHGAERYSNNPYGLNLTEPDELQVFVDLIYSLGVEAALGSVLNQWGGIKDVKQIRDLEIKDQFYYGVSSHFAFESAVTGLPDIEYCYPGDVRVPFSNLPDHSDNAYRFFEKRVTVMELLNYSDEICKEDLNDIINAPETGYCACNKRDNIAVNDFNSFKIDIVLCMVKTVDFVGVAPVNKKSKFTYIVTDPDEAEKCTTKIYGQNTYCGWWLKNTDRYFGIKKLSSAHRSKGQESLQGFPINIYKSQDKSAVEYSVGENKKAQVADIKLQHAVLKSLPAGKYINLKFLRGALGGLEEGAEKYTIDRLITLAMEHNWFIGDTEGFDGKNDGQLKPFEDIPGGLKSEIIGYMQIIADANSKISMYTGINENLIGQKAEELVRNNNALISAGMNALQYVTTAIASQYQKLYTNWANVIKSCIEAGGKPKEAIVSLIGSQQANLIDALDELPLHQMGIKVSLIQDQEWEIEFSQELQKNKINGVIDTIDAYMIKGAVSKKQRFALLAIKIKQWEKRQQKQREEDFANQQAMINQQGENMINAAREKTAGKIQEIYAQGDRDSQIISLAAQLGMQDKQADFLGKKLLQQDRGNDQLNKSIQTLQTKSNLEQQQSLI